MQKSIKTHTKELIKKMRDIVPNITIVSITHDISEAVASDKVIVMNKGEVYATGTPKEVSKVEGSYTGKFLKKYFE